MQKTGEYNSNNAFIYNGNTGNVNNNNKYNTNAVRPVSEFQGNVDPFASFYKSMRAAYRLCLKNKAVGTVWCDYIRFDDDITTATVVKHFRQREICKYNVRKQRRRDLFTLKNLLNDGNTAAN